MLPLTGIRVAEFCQVLAGPFCGLLLADMGAEVIKIESPEGDLIRAWPPILDGYSQYFASVNRNKRSVVLDLKDPGGNKAARELALSCDVVIENFRPGVMARFGLDHATLAKAKPALVYCSVSAFGQTGPRATEGGVERPKVKTYFRPERQVSTKAWGGPAPWCRKSKTYEDPSGMYCDRLFVAVSSSNRRAWPAIQFKFAVPAQSRGSLCDVQT